jgi:hypothetical protein
MLSWRHGVNRATMCNPTLICMGSLGQGKGWIDGAWNIISAILSKGDQTLFGTNYIKVINYNLIRFFL